MINLVGIGAACTGEQQLKHTHTYTTPLAYVTWIRRSDHVSRIGYVSNTDTRPIRILGVPDFFLFSQILDT